MAEVQKVHAEDLLPVRSRVSWGAILAGVMVSLAVFYLLNMLGAAIGISVAGSTARERLGLGAVIWATVATLIALFLGGWVTSQLAVGENRTEAAIYGVILWGTVFTLMLVLMLNSVRLGFTGIVALGSNPHITRAVEGQTEGANANDKMATAREKARRYGAEIQDAATSEEATQAAWWSFGGILLSMIAAVSGSVAGSGPTLVLHRLFVRRPVSATPT
jgi:hypothetical protein